MKRTHNKMLALTLVALSLAACDNKVEHAPPPTQDSATGSQEITKVHTIEEIPDEVSLDAFAKTFAAVDCHWRAQCKNEELIQYIQFGEQMNIILSPLGRPELKDDVDKIEPIFERLKQEQRLRTTPEECEAIVKVSTRLVYLDAKSLQESVDAGRVIYNPKEAASCLKNFAANDQLCAIENKVDPTKDIDFAQLQANQSTFKETVNELAFACQENTLVGQVEDGQPCIAPYECKAGSLCAANNAAGPGAPHQARTCTPTHQP